MPATKQDDSSKITEIRADIQQHLPTYGNSTLLTSLLSSDDHVRRFLTARNGNVKATLTMIESALKYRKEHSLDTILERTPPPLSLRLLHQHAWHGYDKQNRPIYIDNFGHIDLETIESKFDGLERLHYHHYYNEYFVTNILPQASQRANSNIDQITIIYDMSGFTTRLLTSKHIAFIMSIIQCNSLIYPENLGSVYIINAPFTFAMAWAIVKNALSAKQIEKIHIHRGIPKAALLQQIDASQLPQYLGGTCQCDSEGVYEADGYNGCIAASPMMLDLHDHMKHHASDPSISITRTEAPSTPSTPVTPISLSASETPRTRAHSDSFYTPKQRNNEWTQFHQTSAVLVSVL